MPKADVQTEIGAGLAALARMGRVDGLKRAVIALTAAAGLGIGLVAVRAKPQPAGPQPAWPQPDEQPMALLRREQRRLAHWIQTTEARVAAIAGDPEHASDREVRRIADSILARIGPRLAWEEAALYPAVDRRAGVAVTMRLEQENAILRRRLAALRKEAGGNRRVFARHARALLRLMRVHLGREREILLPVLERTMSSAELERELLDNEPAGPTGPEPGYPPVSTSHATR